MKQLKIDIKDAAARCVQAKKAFREAQRALSIFRRENKTCTWQEIRVFANTVEAGRSEAAVASEEMTQLCVFRAHLRGRKHLTENSVYAGCVVGWIDELEPRYMVEESKIAG